jgi:hypothetical protein
MSWQTSTLVTLVILLLVAPPATANDMPVSSTGGTGQTVAPLDDPTVEMVEEAVSIRPSSDGWQVRCKFIFHNTSDEEKAFKVGFPFEVVPDLEDDASDLARDRRDQLYSVEDGEVHDGAPLVWDFEVSIDGEKAERVFVREIDEKSPLKLPNHRMFVWRMSFDKGETVEVVNTYTLGRELHGRRAPGPIEEEFPVNYVLESGAYWHGGKIGRSRIRVESEAGQYVCDPDSVTPKGSRIEHTIDDRVILHWDLKNFRPTSKDNLNVRFCQRSEVTYDIYNGYIEGGPYSPDDDATIEELENELKRFRIHRNTVYAAHGYEFKSADLRKHFENEPWYRVNPAYKPALLDKGDLELVKAIKEMEAKFRKALKEKKAEQEGNE